MFLRYLRLRFKCVRLAILIGIVITIVLGLRLLGQVDGGINARSLDVGNNQTRRESNGKLPFQIIAHPRNIFPALVRRQDKLKTEIRKINETISKMENKSTNSINNAKQSELITQSETQIKIKFDPVSIDTPAPCYDIHAFYYPWYGNPDHDENYIHWNHPFIQHWNQKEAVKWPKGRHEPPQDIGSNYYPSLGAYSSDDPDVVDVHMQMMRYARIGVVVVSWYPPGDSDAEGIQPDSLIPLILDIAHKYALKVALHIEPYKGRDQNSMKENLNYIMDKYGTHPAFYRTNFQGKNNLPLFYIYDSYLVESNKWAEIFTSNGPLSVRNTGLDGIFIGLVVESKHTDELSNAGFDGYFTYFATNGFTYGSTWQHWEQLSQFAKSKNLLFIPSVGPGYVDTEVRPWNAANTRKRLDGKYYQESFSSAMKVSPKIISITSFNEWHEGTQIESAIEKDVPGRAYLDYGKNGPNFYLNLTRRWVDKFSPVL